MGTKRLNNREHTTTLSSNFNYLKCIMFFIAETATEFSGESFPSTELFSGFQRLWRVSKT